MKKLSKLNTVTKATIAKIEALTTKGAESEEAKVVNAKTKRPTSTVTNKDKKVKTAIAKLDSLTTKDTKAKPEESAAKNTDTKSYKGVPTNPEAKSTENNTNSKIKQTVTTTATNSGKEQADATDTVPGSQKRTNFSSKIKSSIITKIKNISAKHLNKLSKKDKKMLIVLTVFLLGISYYLFLLEPLSKMNTSVQASLVKKRKELLVAKTKLAGLNNFRKKINDLKSIIGITKKNNNMPDLDELFNNKMNAVMSAAKKASVKVLSLKPVNAISENEDGTVKTIKDKYISIDGNCDINSFLDFLNNLWGVELEEIELSSASKDGSKLKFYIKIAFLPKINIDEKSIKGESDKDIKFGVKHNIFAKRLPPPPTSLSSKPVEKPKIVHTLTNVKLLGVAGFENSKMAIIKDKQKNITDFLIVGRKFRESKLYEVTKDSAVFLFSDGQTVTLDLPKEKKYYKVDDSKDNTKKKGHLGILAETFTEKLARQYNLPFNPGLLVISSGAHSDVLQKGDLITTINGANTPNFESAINIMKDVDSGQELKIELERKGKTENITYKAD